MKTTLIDLFTSKKFLAALSAVLIYLAGRFGFQLDPAALDRIFAALLVYVGAQGVADVGKSAAAINAVAANPTGSVEANSAMRRVASTVPLLAVLVLGLGVAVGNAGCATARPRATAGLDAALDCTAPSRAAVVADLGQALVDYARKFVSGDKQTVDLAKLKASAAALKGEVLGSCALVTALAILATPKPEASRSLLAEPIGPDPVQWRGALEAMQVELGVRAGG